ncbi:hypothetical protein TNCV_3509261 [Trichonephila clavipes]|nr:hypothetical protein TNCV_3509261 [Trichonephila clavipes]
MHLVVHAVLKVDTRWFVGLPVPENIFYTLLCFSTPCVSELPLVKMYSNPGEGMDACKCIVRLRHGSSLNSRQDANPLVGLVEGKREHETEIEVTMLKHIGLLNVQKS